MRINSSFDDIAKTQALSCGAWNACENLLTYAVSGSEHPEDNGVFLKDLTNERTEKITARGLKEELFGQTITLPGVGEGNPCLSSDGLTLAFLSVVPNWGRQIVLYDRANQACRLLTHLWSGISDPRFSPDGKEILFASFTDPEKPLSYYLEKKNEEAVKPHPAPVMITDFGYKFDGAGFVSIPEHMHLYIVSVETGKIRAITDGAFDYLHHTWCPDGRQVLCVSSRFRPKKDSIAADLLLIDASEGPDTPSIRRLTDKAWCVSYPNPVRPVFTKDGSAVIMGFLSNDLQAENDSAEESTYPPIRLALVPLDGSEETALTKFNAECYDGVQFAYNKFCGRGMDSVQLSSDGKSIYFLAGWEGKTVLYEAPLDGSGQKPRIADNAAIGGIGVPQNGKMLLSCSASNQPEYYILVDEQTMTGETILQSNESLLANRAFSKAEDFSIPTLDGKDHVHGWVLPPQNREEAETYPAILYIHGGPHPFYTWGFTHEHQCFAGAGYAVITCNPRGSSGYGDKHRQSGQAFDGSAYMDLLQFVDEACRRYPWIDRNRIAVTGGSYGGYMTNYMAVHSNRFKAYITQRGISNGLISYASSDMQGSSTAYPHFEEFLAATLKDSLVSYAERVSAPILILHGAEDLRCPVEEAHQWFVALKDTHPDLPIKMVLYPHVGHDQPSDPTQALHYYHEMLTWFDRYVKHSKKEDIE